MSVTEIQITKQINNYTHQHLKKKKKKRKKEKKKSIEWPLATVGSAAPPAIPMSEKPNVSSTPTRHIAKTYFKTVHTTKHNVYITTMLTLFSATQFFHSFFLSSSAGVIFILRGIENLRVEFGSTNRAERVLREPRVGAFQVESVIATGNQPNRLLPADLVEADGAIGIQDEVLAGYLGKLLELRGGEAHTGDGLSRWRGEVGVVGGGVPEKADVDNEDGAHAEAGQEERQKNRVQHVQCVCVGGIGLIW